MSKRQWTPQQQNAINAKNGTLLLSAAAGSGKTAVLVERIIRILTEENSQTNPENLLVVTFTNAAAAEMKQRIALAIDTLAAENPNDPKYSKIRMNLSEATISTMDSFCIKTVRENYHILNIEPDFNTLEDSDLNNLQIQAAENLMNKISVEEKENYDMLIRFSSNYNSDTKLIEKITKLYNISLSYPYPEKWLDETASLFVKPEGTLLWQKTINDYCRDAILTNLNTLDALYLNLEGDEELYEHYKENLKNIHNVYSNIISVIDSGEWNHIVNAVRTASFEPLKRKNKIVASNPDFERTKESLSKIREFIKELNKYYCATQEESNEDVLYLSKYVQVLCNCVKKYSNELNALKKETNAYSFSDFMHMCINLFLDEKGERTPLAKKLSLKFHEILIDEYQDTNDAQDMLFSSISKNGNNLFTVGDVKQSIYSFRMARPELFMKKTHEFPYYDGESVKSKIILGTNFRSRKGVLDGINFFFEQLMTEKSAGIEYNKDEKLNFGLTDYGEDVNTPIEMHFIDSKSDAEKDARYIGKLIKEIMSSDTAVMEKNGTKKPQYKDFCILLRSLKGKSDVYAKTLNDMGIPTYAQKKESLFETTEINLFLSLLSAISNPADDVAVLSAMYSPVFGFTPDELAQIKMNSPKTKLYTAVKEYAEKGDIHANEFISKIEEYRNLSALTPLSVFIQNLLEDTSYTAVVSAMSYGDARKANLLAVNDLALSYEENGENSLSGFIRYIRRSIDNGTTIPVATNVSESANVVRILSIHKSKGLEFPFVILADCCKQFNTQDSKDSLIADSKIGLGIKLTDYVNLKKYDTLSSIAAKINARKNTKAEEMRILYVAMTRARERLITISTCENITDKIGKLFLNSCNEKKINSFSAINSKSYFEWFARTFLKHKDSSCLRKICDIPHSVPYADAPFRMKFILSSYGIEDINETEIEIFAPDSEIMDKIREKAEYIYPYEKSALVSGLVTASGFEKERFLPEFFAKSRPAFMCDNKMSSAQIGSANHLFLQNCDLNNKDVDSQIERMVNEKILTPLQAQVIKKKNIRTFLESDFCKRMRNAEALYREKQFAVFIPAKVFNPDLPDYAGEEKVFVQGVTDAVFVEKGKAYVVDYKTDNVINEQQLIDSYKQQLEIYRIAMESVLHIKVDKTIIYSIRLCKEIEI